MSVKVYSPPKLCDLITKKNTSLEFLVSLPLSRCGGCFYPTERTRGKYHVRMNRRLLSHTPVPSWKVRCQASPRIYWWRPTACLKKPCKRKLPYYHASVTDWLIVIADMLACINGVYIPGSITLISGFNQAYLCLNNRHISV